MPVASNKTSVNSFGYFLESVKEAARPAEARQLQAPQSVDACNLRPADDPQLKILQALLKQPGATCALDLMKETKLVPTVLLSTLKIMNEFGLVKIVQAPAESSGETPPQVELTPCGRKAVELYPG